MQMIKNEKGITMVALAITIIVILILMGFFLGGLTSDTGSAVEKKEKVELSMVSSAVQQQYIKYKSTGSRGLFSW